MGMVLDAGAKRRRADRAPCRAAGYSLVEVLLGLTILMIALVGLMPLFTKSIQQNLEGKQSTEATGHGRTELEEMLQVDFNNWLVEIETNSERAQHLFWSENNPEKRGDEYWTEADPHPTVASWEMDNVVRQFGIQGARDDDLDGILEVIVGLEDIDPLDGTLDNPLPAGSSRSFVHLKSLDVSLQKKAGTVTMGEPMRLDLQTIKAF